jgi:4-hydroxythreonine-4-phosphate dehydrogenase
MTEKKIRVGISIGDINGIGIEVILKTLMNPFLLDTCTPIVYGSIKTLTFHRKVLGLADLPFQIIKDASEANLRRLNLVNVWDQEIKLDLGRETENGGIYALKSLEAAVQDIVDGKIDVLVTAPINKHNIQKAGFAFPGHTEFLESKAEARPSLMFMIGENLRIAVVTGHIPLSEVSSSITQASIVSKLKILDQSLRNDFWVEKPKIAVLGLNPHAGEEGSLGKEEMDIIIPALKQVNEEGIMAFGPYPADGFFGKGDFTKFDAVLAMYHDQGLIPFKNIAFHNGVNFTAGLPFVRTSPDHGTAFDIAGKNLASETSFLEALILACDIFKRRTEQKELMKNPLKFTRFTRDRD